MSHRPVCVKCQTEMRCEKNDVCVLDMFGPGEEVYKAIFADMYKCPGCGVQIVVGFAQEPLTEHFYPNHAARLAMLQRNLRPEHIIRNFERAKVPV